MTTLEQEFKTLPSIQGSYSLKWYLLKQFPNVSFDNFIERLAVTFKARFNENIKKYKEKNPDFVEDPSWQYIPSYKLKVEDNNLNVFLDLGFGTCVHFLMRVDQKNKQILIQN